MDLFLDAALGTAISELLRLVVTAEKRRGDFRGNLETLKNTLESAIFTLNQLEKLNIILSRPEKNTYQFINQLIQGVNLVKECIKIPYWKRIKYSKKLAELEECIEKFFNVGVQGSVAVSSLRNGVGIQEINDKLDFMFKILNIKYEREIQVEKRHEALQSVRCGAYLLSGWESFQGPPDEFEMLQVDAEIQSDSLDEFSGWVTVPGLLPNGVVGSDKEPYVVISGPGSLQDPEIQEVQGFVVVNDRSFDDHYAMSIACQSALPKDGGFGNPDDLVNTPHYGGPEVAWKRDITKPTDGKIIVHTNRVSLDRLPTSVDGSEEIKDGSSIKRYDDLKSFFEGQRIPDITYNMHMCGGSAHSPDLNDMSTHTNLVKPSIGELPDDVCTRGKHVDLNIQKASQIRKRLPGVVIRERSSEMIQVQAFKCQATSTEGGKGKEKIVCKPKKKAHQR